jgi:DNA-directed RNA polymerase subunit N (RpoN/RPB10)
MIIPVRCITCGKVLADKFEFYEKECKKLEEKQAAANKTSDQKDVVERAIIFKKMKIERLCCKRHFLGHVDMMDMI